MPVCVIGQTDLSGSKYIKSVLKIIWVLVWSVLLKWTDISSICQELKVDFLRTEEEKRKENKKQMK